MKKLNSQSIKKILIGVILSDGHLSKAGKSARFDFYNKNKNYSEYIKDVLDELPKLKTTLYKKEDKRFNTFGYRVFTTTHRYLTKLHECFYNSDNTKILSSYILKRIDAEALAHIFMCDGYLEHNLNRKRESIQTYGNFCLECFSKEELEEFIKMLKLNFNIDAILHNVEWGKGYRVRVTAINLQKMIDLIYPYMLESFKYKTILFYKTDKYIDKDLINAEHFIKYYTSINEVEDIIRANRNI